MRSHAWGPWVVAVVLSATGCGSNAGATYDQIIRAYCEWGARCGGGDSAAVDRCNARLSDELRSSGWHFEDAEAAGRISVDGGRASACAAMVRDGDCSQFLGGSQCTDFIVGKVAIGSACADSNECVDGSYCSRPREVGGCPGTCTPLPTAGQPCASYRCAEGLYCSGGTTPLCTAKLAEGSPCSSATQCQTGLTCREPSVGAAKICRQYGSAGQPCGSSLGHDCARGLDCDTSAMPAVCVTRVGEGQPCRTNGSCLDGLVCVRAGTSGSCARPLAVGAGCVVDGETTCAFGLYCDPMTSKCTVPPLREGSTCTTNTDCENGSDARELYCASGTCRPKPRLGESCTPPGSGADDACATGTCSPTTNVCALVCA